MGVQTLSATGRRPIDFDAARLTRVTPTAAKRTVVASPRATAQRCSWRPTPRPNKHKAPPAAALTSSAPTTALVAPHSASLQPLSRSSYTCGNSQLPPRLRGCWQPRQQRRWRRTTWRRRRRLLRLCSLSFRQFPHSRRHIPAAASTARVLAGSAAAASLAERVVNQGRHHAEWHRRVFYVCTIPLVTSMHRLKDGPQREYSGSTGGGCGEKGVWRGGVGAGGQRNS